MSERKQASNYVLYICTSMCKSVPDSSVGKESVSSAGDSSLIPGLGRYPGEGMATHSNILTWEIPWAKEPGGLQYLGSKGSDRT